MKLLGFRSVIKPQKPSTKYNTKNEMYQASFWRYPQKEQNQVNSIIDQEISLQIGWSSFKQM